MRTTGWILIGTTGWLLACGGLVDLAADRAGEAIQEELAEQVVGLAVGGDVELNADGSVTVEADGMRLQAGGNAKLPADFPYPPPDGFEITGVSTVEADGTHTVAAMVMDPTNQAEFIEPLKAKLKADGWEEAGSSTSTVGEATIFAYSAQRDKEMFAVQFQSSPDGSAGLWSWTKPVAP